MTGMEGERSDATGRATVTAGRGDYQRRMGPVVRRRSGSAPRVVSGRFRGARAKQDRADHDGDKARHACHTRPARGAAVSWNSEQPAHNGDHVVDQRGQTRRLEDPASLKCQLERDKAQGGARGEDRDEERAVAADRPLGRQVTDAEEEPGRASERRGRAGPISTPIRPGAGHRDPDGDHDRAGSSVRAVGPGARGPSERLPAARRPPTAIQAPRRSRGSSGVPEPMGQKGENADPAGRYRLHERERRQAEAPRCRCPSRSSRWHSRSSTAGWSPASGADRNGSPQRQGDHGVGGAVLDEEPDVEGQGSRQSKNEPCGQIHRSTAAHPATRTNPSNVGATTAPTLRDRLARWVAIGQTPMAPAAHLPSNEASQGHVKRETPGAENGDNEGECSKGDVDLIARTRAVPHDSVAERHRDHGDHHVPDEADCGQLPEDAQSDGSSSEALDDAAQDGEERRGLQMRHMGEVLSLRVDAGAPEGAEEGPCPVVDENPGQADAGASRAMSRDVRASTGRPRICPEALWSALRTRASRRTVRGGRGGGKGLGQLVQRRAGGHRRPERTAREGRPSPDPVGRGRPTASRKDGVMEHAGPTDQDESEVHRCTRGAERPHGEAGGMRGSRSLDRTSRRSSGGWRAAT